MRTRITWIAAVLALVAIGFLMACSTKYSKSSNGLVIVPTQGSLVMETFSLDLSNGHLSQINNTSGPPIPSSPGPVVLNPAGTFAYVANTVTCTPTLAANTSLTAVQGAIVVYPVNSDGKLSAGTTQYLQGNSSYPAGFPTCGLDDSGNPNAGNPPAAMAIDSAGKYLFVASAPSSAIYTTNLDTTPVQTVATLNSIGIEVFAIGADGSLTEVPGSPFALPAELTGTSPGPSALAVTPTVFPAQFSACSGHSAPATENLYVTDSLSYVVLNFSVDPSSGSLTPVPLLNGAAGVSTGTTPTGVTVDPCGRFVFVSNSGSNTVSAYTICSAVTQGCQFPDFSLQPVTGSPFATGDIPGPLAVDPYGNFLYVVDTGSNQLSGFAISANTGALKSAGIYATGSAPNSISIRGDDTWIFVANLNNSTLSQYAVTPSNGALSPQPSVGTLNTPTGVAVK